MILYSWNNEIIDVYRKDKLIIEFTCQARNDINKNINIIIIVKI